MSQIIPIIDLDIHKRLVKARRVIEKYVPAEKLNSFKLSYKEGKRNVYVVPLSGGSDSTCMAILLKVLFPEVPFVFVFCDTQAESEDLYENLDRLERWAGIQIVRIVPELGLVDYINKYNGFLPSQQARWCTPKLKIEPLDEWFKQNYDLGGNDMIWTHVGIRADETRFGYVSESGEVEMQLPYVKLGIDRSAVYGILSETIGIAPNYRWNSRSSCYCCFFKRRSEKIGLLLNRPHEFDSAARLEKLSDADKERFSFNHVQETLRSLPLNHQDYRIPAVVDIRTSHLPSAPKPIRHKVDRETLDMFDDCQLDSETDKYDVLYVAVAFLTHSMMNMLCSDDSPGVWWQELATYSPTLSGLKKAMVFYWEHKLSTPELYGLSQQEMREEMKIALYQLKLPEGTVDLGRVQDDSYTWATGEAYIQIEHHTRVISQVLKMESLRHQKDELQSKSDMPNIELSWEREQLEYVEAQLQKYEAANAGGFISWSGVFDPPSDDELPSTVMALRKEQSPEVKAESGIACLACSL